MNRYRSTIDCSRGSTLASTMRSKTPTAMPPTIVIGSDRIRAMRATTSARNSSDGPSATAPAATMLPGVMPCNGATRMAVIAAKAAAIVHTIVDVRRTLMP